MKHEIGINHSASLDKKAGYSDFSSEFWVDWG
jgi:hypothetical protein